MFRSFTTYVQWSLIIILGTIILSLMITTNTVNIKDYHVYTIDNQNVAVSFDMKYNQFGNNVDESLIKNIIKDRLSRIYSQYEGDGNEFYKHRADIVKTTHDIILQTMTQHDININDANIITYVTKMNGEHGIITINLLENEIYPPSVK